MKGIYGIRYQLEEANVLELLDPNLGVTTVQSTDFPIKLREHLIDEAKKCNFKEKSETKTGVIQRFNACDSLPEGTIWHILGKHISNELQIRFEEIGCDDVFETPLSLHDFSLQQYRPSRPDESCALSPHRDQSGFINLIVSLLIDGDSAFNLCDGRNRTEPINPKPIEANPGDLIIMRGGHLTVPLPRPFHFISRICTPRGRLVMSLRQITTNETEAEKLRKFFKRKF